MNNFIICCTEEKHREFMESQLKETGLSFSLLIDEHPQTEMEDRRRRIAQNQNLLQGYILSMIAAKDNGLMNFDYIIQIEGDTVLKEDTIENLTNSFEYQKRQDPKIGYMSASTVGRHGIYHIGAWNITEDKIESINHKLKGIQKVDGTGLYCLVTTPDIFIKGHCDWKDEKYGPDVVWGLSLKELGYNIYIDLDIQVGHRMIRKGKESVLWPKDKVENIRFYKEGNDWKTRVYE